MSSYDFINMIQAHCRNSKGKWSKTVMLIESRSSRVYSSKKKMFLGYQKRLYFGIHLYLLYGTWAWAQPRNKLYPYRIRTVKSFSEKMILNTYAPTMKSRDQDYQTLNPRRHIHTHTYTQYVSMCMCELL